MRSQNQTLEPTADLGALEKEGGSERWSPTRWLAWGGAKGDQGEGGRRQGRRTETLDRAGWDPCARSAEQLPRMRRLEGSGLAGETGAGFLVEVSSLPLLEVGMEAVSNRLPALTWAAQQCDKARLGSGPSPCHSSWAPITMVIPKLIPGGTKAYSVSEGG